MRDGRAPLARLEVVEVCRPARLPREDTATVGPHEHERLGRPAVEPPRPRDGFGKRRAGRGLDHHGYAGQHVFQDVARCESSATQDAASDVVQRTPHQLVREPRHQQLRMVGAVSEAQRVGEGWSVVVVVGRAPVVLGVVAPAALCHADDLPPAPQHGVDGGAVHRVVLALRAADVAVAADGCG